MEGPGVPRILWPAELFAALVHHLELQRGLLGSSLP